MILPEWMLIMSPASRLLSSAFVVKFILPRKIVPVSMSASFAWIYGVSENHTCTEVSLKEEVSVGSFSLS